MLIPDFLQRIGVNPHPLLDLSSDLPFITLYGYPIESKIFFVPSIESLDLLLKYNNKR